MLWGIKLEAARFSWAEKGKTGKTEGTEEL